MTGTQYFDDLYRSGASKPGLSRVRALLSRLDNPQNKIKCVHVAGTNGKGSTCVFLESILKASGYKTGAFLSPHLWSIREYIRLDGEVSPEDLFEEYAARIMDECLAIEKSGGDAPTFFEAMVALAYHAFFSESVDIAVIETGMGGTLDATNVIDPLLSVITPVDFDHTAYLGDKIEQISSHKAGIIKPGRPVVLAPQGHAAARTIILDTARQLGSPIYNAEDCNISIVSSTLDGIKFSMDWKNVRETYATVLPGRHQAQNAGTAVLVSHLLNELGFFEINNYSIEKGLISVVWPGRLEVLRGDINYLFDGAHNPHGAKALANFITEQLPGERIILVCGMLSTKHAEGIAHEFSRFTGEVVLTKPDHALARDPQELLPVFEVFGVKTHVTDSIEDAMELATRLAGSGGWVVVSGSLYLMTHAKRVLSGVNFVYPRGLEK